MRNRMETLQQHLDTLTQAAMEKDEIIATYRDQKINDQQTGHINPGDR